MRWMGMIGGVSLSMLRSFESAARHGSLKAAADELGLSPSAVSHAVRQLESALGTRLFDRHPKGLRLTPEGRALTQRLTAGFDEIRRGLADLGGSGSRLLRIHAAPSFAALWLVPRLAGFVRAHPGVELRLAADTDYARFAPDDFDLDIVYGPIRAEDVLAISLGEEVVTPLCSPVLATRISAPADLARLLEPLRRDAAELDRPITSADLAAVAPAVAPAVALAVAPAADDVVTRAIRVLLAASVRVDLRSDRLPEVYLETVPGYVPHLPALVRRPADLGAQLDRADHVLAIAPTVAVRPIAAAEPLAVGADQAHALTTHATLTMLEDLHNAGASARLVPVGALPAPSFGDVTGASDAAVDRTAAGAATAASGPHDETTADVAGTGVAGTGVAGTGVAGTELRDAGSLFARIRVPGDHAAPASLLQRRTDVWELVERFLEEQADAGADVTGACADEADVTAADVTAADVTAAAASAGGASDDGADAADLAADLEAGGAAGCLAVPRLASRALQRALGVVGAGLVAALEEEDAGAHRTELGRLVVNQLYWAERGLVADWASSAATALGLEVLARWSDEAQALVRDGEATAEQARALVSAETRALLVSGLRDVVWRRLRDEHHRALSTCGRAWETPAMRWNVLRDRLVAAASGRPDRPLSPWVRAEADEICRTRLRDIVKELEAQHRETR